MREEPDPVGVLSRNLSRRRSFRSGVGRDDRGWTLLHIGARKGDIKQVGGTSPLFFSYVNLSLNMEYLDKFVVFMWVCSFLFCFVDL